MTAQGGQRRTPAQERPCVPRDNSNVDNLNNFGSCKPWIECRIEGQLSS